MQYFFLIALIVCYTAQNVFSIYFTRTYSGLVKNTAFVYNIICFFGVAIVCLIIALVNGLSTIQPITVILGLINGLIFSIQSIINVKLARCGPYSVASSFSITGGIILPIIESIVLFNFQIGILQIFLIVFLIALLLLQSFVKYQEEKKEIVEKKYNIKLFLLLCIVMFFTNGTYGAIIATHKKLVVDIENSFAESEILVCITYAFTVLFSIISLLISNKGKILPCFKSIGRVSLSCAICGVIAVSGGLLINILVLGLLDEAIVSPISCGGTLVFVSLSSFLFFGEKVTKKSFAILLGIVVVVVVLSFI